MSAALHALLSAAYPGTYQPPEPELPDELQQDAAQHVTQAIHAFESQLGRPMTIAERAQIADAATLEYHEAVTNADELLSRFEADLDEQTVRLERDLGRRLLAHELNGIREQGHHALTVRGEALDAKAALTAHYAHRGENIPDPTAPDEAGRRARDEIALARLQERPQHEPTPAQLIRERADELGDPPNYHEMDRATAQQARDERAMALLGLGEED